MSLLRFDESQLVTRLERLRPRLRVAFAASCAQRLLPAYVNFVGERASGDGAEFAHLLERLWNDLERRAMTAAQVQEGIDRAEATIPSDDVHEWIPEQPYAEDAAMALAYAFRSRQNGNAQEAAWAARHAYEALDHFVIDRWGIDINEPGAEMRVLSDPLVQAEFARQERDLNELKGADEPDEPSVVHRLRERSEAESNSFFRQGN